MTVSTKAHARSGFVKFAGLFALFCSLALHAMGQTSHDRSIGTDLHSPNDASLVESDSEGREPLDVHGAADASHRLLIPQTETKRKPNLPISAINASKQIPEEAVTTSNESTVVEKSPEPAWRPFEKLPRQSRFLKEEEGDADGAVDNGHSEKFHWKPAILQSLLIQGFQHAYALTIQEKTRRALKGPFFKDYWESVKGVRGWTDGNKFFTNYVAHPMQGGMTGFIFVQNHDRAKRQKFGESKQYWKDRFKAFVWSAAWSTNWELGPISQSSIGNVGLYGHQGYVDLVVTPTVGTGWLLTEEALDRYIIRHLETKSFAVKIFARTLLNPMRAVANALRFKEPWYRDRPYGYTASTSVRGPAVPSR
jgi:hypothetical protein